MPLIRNTWMRGTIVVGASWFVLIFAASGSGNPQPLAFPQADPVVRTRGGEAGFARKGLAAGSDAATAIVVDGEGNAYVAGYCASSTGRDYVTIQYDSLGVRRWVAQYDGPAHGQDGINAIALDKRRCIVVTGYSGGGGDTADWATIKYGPLGDEKWVARFQGPTGKQNGASALAIDDSGAIYVVGEVTGVTSKRDFATVKYDAEGSQLWVAYYDGPAHDLDFSVAIALDDHGDCVVTGFSINADGGRDIVTIKYTAGGLEEWAARFDNPQHYDDSPSALAVDRSGNVYVTGTSGTSDALFPRMDYVTVSYDPNGRQRWVAYYNGIDGYHEDRSYGIAVDTNLNTYITGYSTGYGSDGDIATVKYDSNGVQQWVARYDGPAHSLDGGVCIRMDEGGYLYVGGFTYGTCAPDYILLKYSTAGVQQWLATYNGPADGMDMVSALAVNNERGAVVTGRSTDSALNVDFATVSYTGNGSLRWVARYDGGGPPVAEVNVEAAFPRAVALEQNYPNPFNPSTSIRYGLPNRSHVTVNVFNILGKQVAILQNGEQDAGYHEVRFDGSNLPSGVYFYRLHAGSYRETKKLLLVR